MRQSPSLENCTNIMPLTDFQKQVAKILAKNRSQDSHLAGGAALHYQPNSIRYSNDLDYFHDSIERVASAFSADEKDLSKTGHDVSIEIKQPGYIRAQVSRNRDSTKIEWSHDSDWRFFPVEKNNDLGFILHPADLAINKVLALAGRNEPRDFLDTLHVHKNTLSLGALCWAAAGKDPGFTPLSLLDLLRRRGKFQQADFNRLKLNHAVELPQLKSDWLQALAEAQTFIDERPPEELGCLYLSKHDQKIYAPRSSDQDYLTHFGRPGGVLPKIIA